MLEKIKVILNITDGTKDALLNILIDKVVQQIINYTHNPECIMRLENIIMDMVVREFNRLGSEGLASEDYSGVKYSYEATLPSDIMDQLKIYRKIRTVHD